MIVGASYFLVSYFRDDPDKQTMIPTTAKSDLTSYLKSFLPKKDVPSQVHLTPSYKSIISCDGHLVSETKIITSSGNKHYTSDTGVECSPSTK